MATKGYNSYRGRMSGGKIVLIVVYVVLGVFAMRPGRRQRTRALCYAVALLVFATIYGIARAHHPLGWLAAAAT